MGISGQGFPRAKRLLRGSEFKAVTRHGQRAAGSCFVVVAAPRQREPGRKEARVGLTVSRRVGGAVVRNRVKRRIREWFRTQAEDLPVGVDLVVIARRGAGELSGEQVAQRLRMLVADATGPRG